MPPGLRVAVAAFDPEPEVPAPAMEIAVGVFVPPPQPLNPGRQIAIRESRDPFANGFRFPARRRRPGGRTEVNMLGSRTGTNAGLGYIWVAPSLPIPVMEHTGSHEPERVRLLGPTNSSAAGCAGI